MAAGRDKKNRAAPQPKSGLLRLRNPRVALGESFVTPRRSVRIAFSQRRPAAPAGSPGSDRGRIAKTAGRFDAALTEPVESSSYHGPARRSPGGQDRSRGRWQLSSGSRVASDTSRCSRPAKAWCVAGAAPGAVECALGHQALGLGRTRRERFGGHAHRATLRTVAALGATGGRRLLAAGRARGTAIKATSTRPAADGARREQRCDR